MKLDATFFDRVQGAAHAAAASSSASTSADVAVVLGSGLGGVADRLEGARSVPYASLPGFPETTVAGHPGRLSPGRSRGKTALLLCGRVHGYEGYPPCEVGFGVRVVGRAGRADADRHQRGGRRRSVAVAGEIVAISDHINLTGGVAAVRTQRRTAGPALRRHDRRLRSGAARASRRRRRRRRSAGPLREAIYAGMAGPAYETPAEVRLLRTLGAGLVGMSTVHEVITARHAGLVVLGLSLVANPAAGVNPGQLRHEDVTRAAAAGADAMGRLIAAVVRRCRTARESPRRRQTSANARAGRRGARGPRARPRALLRVRCRRRGARRARPHPRRLQRRERVATA